MEGAEEGVEGEEEPEDGAGVELDLPEALEGPKGGEGVVGGDEAWGQLLGPAHAHAGQPLPHTPVPARQPTQRPLWPGLHPSTPPHAHFHPWNGSSPKDLEGTAMLFARRVEGQMARCLIKSWPIHSDGSSGEPSRTRDWEGGVEGGRGGGNGYARHPKGR